MILDGMIERSTRGALLVALIALTGCAVKPLSEQLAGRPIPVGSPASAAQVGETAELIFSAGRKYESEKGIPVAGDPVVCADGLVTRVNDGERKPDRTTVAAGREIAVTSVITWSDGRFSKICGPLVTFVPEAGHQYVVVNERFGGKGFASMWRGMAFQHCKVSVYRISGAGFTPVEVQPAQKGSCRVGSG